MKFCSCHICHVFFYSNCSGVATFAILGRICQTKFTFKKCIIFLNLLCIGAYIVCVVSGYYSGC